LSIAEDRWWIERAILAAPDPKSPPKETTTGGPRR
jgi:hypothetical protein